MHGREKPQPLRGEYMDALGVTSLKFHNLKGSEMVWPHHLVAPAWADSSKFLAPTSIEILHFQSTNRRRSQEGSHFERSSGIRCIGLKQVGSPFAGAILACVRARFQCHLSPKTGLATRAQTTQHSQLSVRR